jgi:hypothetical protein
VLDAATPLPEDLPVAGGWGYSREDACIITDARESDDDEVRGLDFEFIFIEHRVCEELNTMHTDGRLADIRWKTLQQDMHRDPDGRPAFDHFTVQVTAFLESDLAVLEHASEAGGGTDGSPVDGLTDTSGRRDLMFRIVRDFWFDISRVPGIPDDAEFSMRMSRGRIT